MQREKMLQGSQGMERSGHVHREYEFNFSRLAYSPKKTNVVLKMLRNMHFLEVLAQLRFCRKAASIDLYKMLKSALNSIENYTADSKIASRLVLTHASVGKDISIKRRLVRAKSRSDLKVKRFSKVYFKLRIV